MGSDVLLVRLSKGLVGILSLLLEQLESSLQGLVLGAMLLTFIGSLLEVLDGGLELLHLRLEEAVLVLERGDFLFLGQILLFKRLDLGLQLLDLGGTLVGLEAQRVHFLVAARGQSESPGDLDHLPLLGRRWPARVGMWEARGREKKRTSLMRSILKSDEVNKCLEFEGQRSGHEQDVRGTSTLMMDGSGGKS